MNRHLCILFLLLSSCSVATLPSPKDPIRIEDEKSNLERSEVEITDNFEISSIDILGDGETGNLTLENPNSDNAQLTINSQPSNDARIGAIPSQDEHLLLGSVFGVYKFNDKTQHFASVYNLSDRLPDGYELVPAPKKEQDIGWINVDFEYNTYNGESYNTASLNDGKIYVFIDEGIWRARFGEVYLDGRIDGMNIEGTSSLGDMIGTFEGFDGQLENDGNYMNAITFGAFSGNNKTGGHYAGGWLESTN